MPAIIDKIAHALHLDKAEAHAKVEEQRAEATATTSTAPGPPVFDSQKVTVVFVLGGPGAGMPVQYPIRYFFISFSWSGKGTQSEKLVEEFGFAHISGVSPIMTIPLLY
jgi:UMP-CMP kinase